MEKTKPKAKLPEVDSGLLSSPLSSQFIKKTPKIGTNRKLHIKKIIPEQIIIPREKIYSSYPINTLPQNDLEYMGTLNIDAYSNGKLKLVYTDCEEEKENLNKNIIDYKEVLRVMNNDTSTFENFISPENGEWIEVEENKNESNDLKFDSMFEEGNLRMAVQINENEYDLIMRKDFNNISNYSWFFFEVESPTQREVKFNIINFAKKKLFFTNNSRVLVYNENDKWTRNTYNVCFYSNGFPLPANLVDETNSKEEADDNETDQSNTKTNPIFQPPTEFYTTLTFSYNFRKDLIGKKVYFAYCFPYTYTNLQDYLYSLSINPNYKSLIKFSTLGKTLCGNPLDIIYITNWNDNNLDQKKIICFTGRVHPGESNGSYVVEGVINTLLSEQSEELRKNFIFKIVPMLNPDGIINGCYRNNILGKDLNRLWVDPRLNFSPTIYNTKNLLKLNHPEFYCDFHGHSCISNICMYGSCQTVKAPSILCQKGYRQDEEKVFNKIFEKYIKYYNKEASRYGITKSKKRTARGVSYNELGIAKCYCLETSTISFSDELGDYPINLEMLRNVGKDFIDCLEKFFNKNIFLGLWTIIRQNEDNKKKKKGKKGKKKKVKEEKEITYKEEFMPRRIDEQIKRKFNLDIDLVKERKRAESEGRKVNLKFNQI